MLSTYSTQELLHCQCLTFPATTTDCTNELSNIYTQTHAHIHERIPIQTLIYFQSSTRHPLTWLFLHCYWHCMNTLLYQMCPQTGVLTLVACAVSYPRPCTMWYWAGVHPRLYNWTLQTLVIIRSVQLEQSQTQEQMVWPLYIHTHAIHYDTAIHDHTHTHIYIYLLHYTWFQWIHHNIDSRKSYFRRYSIH